MTRLIILFFSVILLAGCVKNKPDVDYSNNDSDAAIDEMTNGYNRDYQPKKVVASNQSELSVMPAKAGTQE